MKFEEWYIEHSNHLYEIYYHIILPHRKKLKEVKKESSTLSYQDFLRIAFETHGSRLVQKRRI